VVKLPATRISELTVGLKITGKDLKPVPIPESSKRSAPMPTAA